MARTLALLFFLISAIDGVAAKTGSETREGRKGPRSQLIRREKGGDFMEIQQNTETTSREHHPDKHAKEDEEYELEEDKENPYPAREAERVKEAEEQQEVEPSRVAADQRSGSNMSNLMGGHNDGGISPIGCAVPGQNTVLWVTSKAAGHGDQSVAVLANWGFAANLALWDDKWQLEKTFTDDGRVTKYFHIKRALVDAWLVADGGTAVNGGGSPWYGQVYGSPVRLKASASPLSDSQFKLSPVKDQNNNAVLGDQQENIWYIQAKDHETYICANQGAIFGHWLKMTRVGDWSTVGNCKWRFSPRMLQYKVTSIWTFIKLNYEGKEQHFDWAVHRSQSGYPLHLAKADDNIPWSGMKQRWIIEQSTTRPGAYLIRLDDDPEMFLRLAGGKKSDGTRVELFKCDRGKNYWSCEWKFSASRRRPGAYFIKSACSTKDLWIRYQKGLGSNGLSWARSSENILEVKSSRSGAWDDFKWSLPELLWEDMQGPSFAMD